jgi:hypothetical protein
VGTVRAVKTALPFFAGFVANAYPSLMRRRIAMLHGRADRPSASKTVLSVSSSTELMSEPMSAGILDA